MRVCCNAVALGDGGACCCGYHYGVRARPGFDPLRAEPTTSRVSWGRYLLSVLDGQNGTTCGHLRIALARSIALARHVARARRGAMT
jgi:hypothetical protein